MKANVIVISAIAILTLSACNMGDADLKTDEQKFSYAIGLQIGQNLKRQGMEVDTDALAQAIIDVMSDSEHKLSKEEMQAAMQAAQKKKVAERDELGKKNLEEEKKFLAENGKKEGVVTTKSGVQYKVTEKGTGKNPKATDTVVVHYRGTLTDGREFDSSYKRNEPATFAVNGVIKGWQEILPMMKEGGKWHVAIPSSLGYGARGAGGMIGPNATLVFEIQLVSIKAKTTTKTSKN